MLTPPEIARSLLAAGESKARLPFGKMLLLAILAGAYIALAGVGATAARRDGGERLACKAPFGLRISGGAFHGDPRGQRAFSPATA